MYYENYEFNFRKFESLFAKCTLHTRIFDFPSTEYQKKSIKKYIQSSNTFVIVFKNEILNHDRTCVAKLNRDLVRNAARNPKRE